MRPFFLIIKTKDRLIKKMVSFTWPCFLPLTFVYFSSDILSFQNYNLMTRSTFGYPPVCKSGIHDLFMPKLQSLVVRIENIVKAYFHVQFII